MRYLDISGKNAKDDAFEVYRRMLFPNDETSYENLFFMQEAKKIVDDSDFSQSIQEPLLGIVKAEQVKLLIKNLMWCPPVDEMRKKIESSLGYSLVSAMFLVNFFRLYKQGCRASLKIATYATEEVLRKTGLKIGDITKTRNKYGDSSHISAAFLLMDGDKSDLVYKLAGAELLRKFGEEFQLENRTSPLLNPDTTWKVPPEYGLPVVEIGPIPDDAALAVLAQKYIKNAIWAKRSR